MIDRLLEWDKALFLWLNSRGHPTFDGFMLLMSEKWVWLPLYLLLIYLLYRQYGISFWKPLILILLAVGCSDFVTSGIMKPFFERLRPCRDPELITQMIIVKCGGKYGFASSHAANTFAIAVFFTSIIRKKWMFILLLWAFLVSYSRIHLGAHYPGDILVGAVIGSLFGFLAAHFSKSLTERKSVF